MMSEYDYELPDDRIAKVPLKDRASSKLLVAGQGGMETRTFRDLPSLLPKDSFLVLNESKVILARVAVNKKTGGGAEIFCLDPLEPSRDPAVALATHDPVVWNCLVGGKKIVQGDVLMAGDVQFTILKKNGNEAEVRIQWADRQKTFGEILEAIGKIPLPPYLKRDPVAEDQVRYQTVYAKQEGSVAAPTAGLHFTDQVFEDLRKHGHQVEKVCLHVGAGTFKPVSAEDVKDHTMHAERFEVSLQFLKSLHAHLKSGAPVVAVGTTSLRTLESLVWLNERNFAPQWAWKDQPKSDPVQAIGALIKRLEVQNQSKLIAETQILIAPGYDFRIASCLVTNFHQPRSTLLLLVSAFLGDQKGGWKRVYDYALSQGYRFLSFGDSSLLFLGCG
ncbi:MAG: tRNA preQ1(34) S-adenosylmethionine ribosyltransferase-isomerase QueA [Bdellovibrionales bacterium]|nr:tRNA preQ1(34) S-adenosylmethionine ribosyltransferase-isomerase QueA [Bdellovibrionales bacterium]